MTGPDPVAELAEQVAQLLGQLARTQGELGALRERFNKETSQTVLLRAEIKRLRERLKDAIDRGELAPPPPPYWLDSDAEEMFGQLRKFVDGFLRRHYPGYMTRLRPCWAAHGEAVWELGNLWAEHIRIYGDADNRDLAGALAWHDRWLPGVLNRLAASMSKCDETGCQVAREKATREGLNGRT